MQGPDSGVLHLRRQATTAAQPACGSNLVTADFKVLLIEDDEVAADMYRLALLAAGRVVVVARDGEEGLRMASAENPDFVILDVRLPKLNGFDVLSNLRTNPKTKQIPVIILTNLGDADMIKRGSALGALEFMIKAHTTPRQLSLRIAEHERWMQQMSEEADQTTNQRSRRIPRS